MKFDYKLSIIIPCYNSSKTIRRLLDSIVNNDLRKDEYEIVIVDDNSTDNFMDIVNTYKSGANIAYYKTNTKVHCPGNTREVGLINAKGEWLAFSDHDDYFEPNIFMRVFDTIEYNHIDTVLCAAFYGRNADCSERFSYNEDDRINWCHGKFYNHQMLIDGNIHFKKNLISHEDVYFNNIIKTFLMINDKTIQSAPDLFVYNWVHNDESLSNRNYGRLNYMDKHFADYIYANYEPIFMLPDDRFKDYKYNMTLTRYMITYFVYQDGIYRLGDVYKEHNFKAVCDLTVRICRELNITYGDIIQYIYSEPETYHTIKTRTFNNICTTFLEDQSVKDFIISIADAMDKNNILFTPKHLY